MKLKITKDVFRISEPFTISRGSQKLAHVLTVEAKHNWVRGFGEAEPYARFGEKLTSVKAQIEALPDILTRKELHDLLLAGSTRRRLILRFRMLRQRRLVKGYGNWWGLPHLFP